MLVLHLHQIDSPLPVVKVEILSPQQLSNNILLFHMVKFMKKSTGQAIYPWIDEDLYPTQYPLNLFESAISCYLKFDSVQDMHNFMDSADNYRFDIP